MPHLAVQYSSNISAARMQAFCNGLHGVIAANGLFPLAGIRVRAIACEVFAIADLHIDNAFVDMIFHIAAGRSEADRANAGRQIMAFAETFFAAELARPHFALSLEITEISRGMSWKANPMHTRLKGTS